MALLA